MRIGFDAKRAYNNKSGLGNFSRNIIRLLAKEYSDNRYFLFNPGTKSQLFITPSDCTEITPKKIWNKLPKSIWRRFQITKEACRLQLNIYHGVSHELPVGIEKTGIGTVVTIHDVIYLRYPQLFFVGDRRMYLKKTAHACKVADRVHAISNQTKSDLIEFLKVPEDKIKVIYQSVNPLFLKKPSEEEKKDVAAKFKLPSSFILNVGTIEKRKNLLVLLESMVSSKLTIPLVVVGKPTAYFKEINAFLQKHPELNVYFPEHVSDRELMVFYNLAEVSVYPSIFEGFGQPVIESQAAGCPVITSNASSLPEAGGDGAIYFDPTNPQELGSKLKQLLEDKKLKETMIEKGNANMKRFSEKVYAKNLMNLYKEINHA